MDQKQGSRLVTRRMGMHTKQVCLDLPAKMFEGIVEKAKECGLRPSQYAMMLLEAAYAVRVGKVEDNDLDATIGIVVVLSTQLETAKIARGLKITEDLVVKIIDAWRDETAGRK
jgi:hypothetical protein